MALFIIAAEPLLENIRQNTNIKGYKLPNGKEKKVLSYADDNNFLISDKSSIKHIFDTIETFGRASGAKLNKDKTEAIKLGTWKYIDIREILGWEKKQIKLMGQIFTYKNMEQLNYANCRLP